ncbi:MAG: hypothetical protein WBX11_03440 [Thiobacillaceae bacterium]
MNRIRHIALQVNDIPLAVAWYQREFNCRVHSQNATCAQITVENLSLTLVGPGQHSKQIGPLGADANRSAVLRPPGDGTASVHFRAPWDSAQQILDRSTL